MSVEQQIIEIIKEKLNIQDCPLEAKFTDLGADSLDTIEIVIALEETFNIVIDDEESNNIQTVQQVVDAVKALVK